MHSILGGDDHAVGEPGTRCQLPPIDGNVVVGDVIVVREALAVEVAGLGDADDLEFLGMVPGIGGIAGAPAAGADDNQPDWIHIQFSFSSSLRVLIVLRFGYTKTLPTGCRDVVYNVSITGQRSRSALTDYDSYRPAMVSWPRVHGAAGRSLGTGSGQTGGGMGVGLGLIAALGWGIGDVMLTQ